MRHKLLLFFITFLSYVPYGILGALVFLGYITTWEVHWFSFDWFGTTISVDLNILYIPYLASSAIGLTGGFLVWCFINSCDEPFPFVTDDVNDTFQIDL